MARLRRAVLLGAGIGAAGAGEGRGGALRVGVERRGAAAAVRRALRLARVALPRLPPGPRRAVSAARAVPLSCTFSASAGVPVGSIRPRRYSFGPAEAPGCSSIASIVTCPCGYSYA